MRSLDGLVRKPRAGLRHRRSNQRPQLCREAIPRPRSKIGFSRRQRANRAHTIASHVAACRPSDNGRRAQHHQRHRRGITSPDAGGAGDDCTAAMHEGKLTKYGPYMNELSNCGITYCPAVWSAFGRPHPESLKLIRAMARRGARRRGNIDVRTLERRTLQAVTTEIWRRNARMIKACWMTADDDGPGGL